MHENGKPPLGHLMSYTSRLMLTLLHRNFRKAGFELSHEQWIILLMLWRSDPKGISQQALGQRSGKDKASITRLLQSLEDAGLVLRKADPKDARIRLVQATAKARKLEESTRSVLAETQAQIEKGFSEADLQQTTQLLDRIRLNTEQALGRKAGAGEFSFLDEDSAS